MNITNSTKELIKQYENVMILLGEQPMKITMTELKEDLKKYIELSKKEDVFITKNGKVVARLVGVDTSKGEEWLDSVTGILPEDAPVEEWLKEHKERFDRE